MTVSSPNVIEIKLDRLHARSKIADDRIRSHDDPTIGKMRGWHRYGFIVCPASKGRVVHRVSRSKRNGNFRYKLK